MELTGMRTDVTFCQAAVPSERRACTLTGMDRGRYRLRTEAGSECADGLARLAEAAVLLALSNVDVTDYRQSQSCWRDGSSRKRESTAAVNYGMNRCVWRYQSRRSADTEL